MPPKNHKPPKRLHFLALVVPGPVQSELTGFKHLARERFGAGHALNAPAHITLIPPFFATAGKMENFIPQLAEFIAGFPPWELEIKNFGRFGKRVIYAAVVPHPALNDFQAALFSLFKSRFPSYPKPNRFHPHLTVAHRDLTPEQFPAAWHYFSALSYERKIIVDKLSILIHRERKWHIMAQLPFGKI